MIGCCQNKTTCRFCGFSNTSEKNSITRIIKSEFRNDCKVINFEVGGKSWRKNLLQTQVFIFIANMFGPECESKPINRVNIQVASIPIKKVIPNKIFFISYFLSVFILIYPIQCLLSKRLHTGAQTKTFQFGCLRVLLIYLLKDFLL